MSEPNIILELPTKAMGGQIAGFSRTRAYLRHQAGTWRVWFHPSEIEIELVAEVARLQAIVDKPPRQPNGDYLQCPLCRQYLDTDGECPEGCGNVGQWLANYEKAQAVIDENARLQAIVDKLLEVGDDLRCYTHDWDWKYGEYWDKELNEAREAAEASREK